MREIFSDVMNNKLPPCNIDAEESILGGILLDPEALNRIIHIIHPNAFYVQAHRNIYQAAISLNKKGQPTDLMTVTTWLADHNMLEKIGGTATIVRLASRTVSAVNIDRYAELVMDKYQRRKLISTGHEVIELGHDTATELDEVLDRSQKKVFEVTHGTNQNIEHNADISARAYDSLCDGSPIYRTGIENLDNLIVGFEAGMMTIAAGRPSMGKSQFGLYCALQTIVLHQLPVLIFSLEMTKEQLEYRLWSLMSCHPHYQTAEIGPINSDRIRKHRSKQLLLNERELNNIANVAMTASNLPLYINDDRSIKPKDIAASIRTCATKEKKKIGLVVIDYLQMMASVTGANRSYELGEVARELYKIAGDLEIPILALSQINREVETKNCKRPSIANLSQSGILEMVADNIILLYRDEYYNPNSPDEGILELIVAKSRHGQTGTAKVNFDRRYGIIF